MSKVLTINTGSSSVKYSVFDQDTLLLSGLIERIGDDARHCFDEKQRKVSARTYAQAFQIVFSRIKDAGITIDAVGHRVVHGGRITGTTRLTPKTLEAIKELIPLAPLHNGPELEGIHVCQKLFGVPNFAVFDTAFHTTIPSYASTYAIPMELGRKYGIRRFGFHGINHKYLALEAARHLRKKPSICKIITCHLGNGCSITAVDGGKSVDTSMGFTPLEGLMMGTRCGDIDAGIVTFLQREGYSAEHIDELLNERSGLLGISGLTRDMRELLARKNAHAKLAVDMFCYRAAKYIGAYLAVLDGADAIIFSAGIGENAAVIREKILQRLHYAGIIVDKKKNTKNAATITAAKSRIKVFVISADEACMIAREVHAAIKAQR